MDLEMPGMDGFETFL